MGKEILLSDGNEGTIRPREQQEFEGFLVDKNWVPHNCPHCSSEYFAKERSATISCGSYECTGYEFIDRPVRRTFFDTYEVSEKITSAFESLAYKKAEAIPVVNQIGSTLFAGTSAQYYDTAIFQEERIDVAPIVIAQPVIRLQGKDLVGKVDGFTTAFVNIATEQSNATMTEHLQNFDHWLQQLSSLGLFMGDFSLKVATDKPEWGKHRPDAITVKINYLGLELGVANYFTNILQQTRAPLTLSDMSFGLERIAWGLNKTPSYYDMIGPINYSAKGNHKLMDDYRTMTLMSGSGVVPSNKDRGSKFRMLAKSSATPTEPLHPDLIDYYYEWWGQFANLPLQKSDAADIIVREVNRNTNIEIRKRIKGPESIPLEITPDEYARHLMKTGKNINNVKDIFKGSIL